MFLLSIKYIVIPTIVYLLFKKSHIWHLYNFVLENSVHILPLVISIASLACLVLFYTRSLKNSFLKTKYPNIYTILNYLILIFIIINIIVSVYYLVIFPINTMCEFFLAPIIFIETILNIDREDTTENVDDTTSSSSESNGSGDPGDPKGPQDGAGEAVAAAEVVDESSKSRKRDRSDSESDAEKELNEITERHFSRKMKLDDSNQKHNDSGSEEESFFPDTFDSDDQLADPNNYGIRDIPWKEDIYPQSNTPDVSDSVKKSTPKDENGENLKGGFDMYLAQKRLEILHDRQSAMDEMEDINRPNMDKYLNNEILKIRQTIKDEYERSNNYAQPTSGIGNSESYSEQKTNPTEKFIREHEHNNSNDEASD